MGVLDDEFTPGTTQATTPVTPAPSSSSSSSSSSTFTVSTTPTAIDVSGGSSTDTLTGASSSSSSSTAAAVIEAPKTEEPPPLEKRTIAAYVNQRGGSLMFKTDSGVVVNANIIDRTSAAGMTPKAMQILETMAENAAAAGIFQIDVTAARGGGHKSHSAGTEFDLKGYTEDGTLWTPEQRAAVAAAGAMAGADRFGLYSFGKGFLGSGSLHIGYSGQGRPSAVWGFRGQTGGDASRAFTNPAEVKFRDMFIGGSLSKGFQSFVQGGPLLRGNYLGDRLTNEVPDPRIRPDLTSPAFGARGAAELQGLAVDGPMTIATVGGVVIDQSRIFGKGEQGDHVADLQAFLNSNGITDNNGNPLAVDGVFGRLTKQAVKTYQARSQIGVDGKVGPETYQAMLYDLNPGAAVMPGKAAYLDGAAAARPVVDPASAVPMPRPRPSREEAVPIPRTRADFYALRLSRSAHYQTRYGDLPGLTKAETSLTPLPGEQPVETPPPATSVTVDEGRTARREALIELATMRARQGVGSQVFSEGQTGIPFTDPIVRDQAARQERYRQMVAENDAYFGTDSPDLPDPLADRGTRESRAIDRAQAMLLSRKVVEEGDSAAASDLAMRQRFADAHAGGDALRIMPDAEVSFGPTLVRTAEAIREFVRGLGDSYRRAIAQRQGLAPYDPFGTKSSTKDQSRLGEDPPAADAVLRADPTPSGAVTSIYSFGPGPVTRKQRIDDRAKRLAE